MKIQEAVARIEKHEAECSLRYEEIQRRLEDGKQKIEFKTLNVFGPRIGYVQLPKDVVARMMTITKDAIEDKEKVKRN